MADPQKTAGATAVNNMLPFGSRTDIGYVREHNEDSLLVAPPLYVVCDGMGGHKAGEVASEIAIQTISKHAPEKLDVDALGRAVEEANLAVIKGAETGAGREGMGTTCTAAMMEDGKLIIAQAGDSRAYLVHAGKLQQLTRDHSVVADLVEAGEITPEEARTHQWRSYITRALGLDPYMQADLYELNVSRSDRLMLCTDGLYSMVTDKEIERILTTNQNPQQAADKLVEAALEGGGTDNITVVVADAREYSARKTRKMARRAKLTAILIVAFMVLLIGGLAAGFGYYVDTAAYLGVENGNVVIYRGVPGKVLGMSFSKLEERTDVPISDVNPGTVARIEEGSVRFDTVDDARKAVDGYRQDAKSKRQQPGEGASSSSSSSSSSAASSSSSAASSSAANVSGSENTAAQTAQTAQTAQQGTSQ